MKHLKRKEVATRLDVTESEILRLVAEGQLTPFISFHEETMYGLQVGKLPFNIAGIVRVTGLLHPPVESLAAFLHRGIDDEIHYAPFFLASEKCTPEISQVDEGWGDAKFDISSIHPSISGFSVAPGLPGLITTADDIASMDRFEPAQSIDYMKTNGYPIRLEAFVYLESEVESIAGKRGLKASEMPENKLSLFRDMDNLIFSEVTFEFTSDTTLNISARDVSRGVHCAEMGLYDTKAKRRTILADTLFDIALGNKLRPRGVGPKLRKRVSDLRTLLKKQLSIKKDNPFQADWKPNFKVIDGVKKADDRAKANAVHVSFNDKIHGADDQSQPPSQGNNYSYDDEFDEAGEYLRGIDGNVNSP